MRTPHPGPEWVHASQLRDAVRAFLPLRSRPPPPQASQPTALPEGRSFHALDRARPHGCGNGDSSGFCGLDGGGSRRGWLDWYGVQASSGSGARRARAILLGFGAAKPTEAFWSDACAPRPHSPSCLPSPAPMSPGWCSPRPGSWWACAAEVAACTARAAGQPERSMTAPPAAGGTWTWAPRGSTGGRDSAADLSALPAGADRDGTVGPARRPVHSRRRRRRCLPGPAHRQDHHHPAVALLLGGGGRHHGAGGRHLPRRRPPGRAVPHRHRRGLLPQGSPLPDRGRRPRPCRRGHLGR
jgi:hypothetical protein